MPLSYRILKSRNLVYVRYEGFLGFEESSRGFMTYPAHPDFRPGQNQLVDLTHATGFERDFGRLMALQAQKLDVLGLPGQETIFVFLAPHPEGYGLAHFVARSWQEVPNVVVRVQSDEVDALDILGIRERSVDALLAQV